jgi:hypothetical protein
MFQGIFFSRNFIKNKNKIQNKKALIFRCEKYKLDNNNLKLSDLQDYHIQVKF